MFPEASEEPLFVGDLVISDSKEKKGLTRKTSLLSKFRGSGGKLQEPFDPQYDLKFLQCLLREMMRNQAVSQCDLMLAFFELDNIFSAISKNEISFVRYFIDRSKTDLQTHNRAGQSPLHCAIEKNNKQMVEALVTGGANPNFLSKKGQGSLHYAIDIGAPKEIIALLIDHGADLNLKDDASSASPLHYAAARSPEILLFLLEKGANINIQV